MKTVETDSEHGVSGDSETPDAGSTDSHDPALKPDIRSGQTVQDARSDKHQALDPTRYGDWEKNGRCIDF